MSSSSISRIKLQLQLLSRLLEPGWKQRDQHLARSMGGGGQERRGFLLGV